MSNFTKTAIRQSMAFYGMGRGEFERAIAGGAMKGLSDNGEPPIVIIDRWLAAQGACVRCDATPVRDTLDGDALCQSCCDQWVRGEALSDKYQAIADAEVVL